VGKQNHPIDALAFAKPQAAEANRSHRRILSSKSCLSISALVDYLPGMNSALRWFFGVLGIALVAVTPYLWFVNPALLWIACPLLAAWAFWLMLEYLRWAETLRKK